MDLIYRPVPKALRTALERWTSRAFLVIFGALLVWFTTRPMEIVSLREVLLELAWASLVGAVLSRMAPAPNTEGAQWRSLNPLARSEVALYPGWIQRDVDTHQWHRTYDEIDSYAVLRRPYGKGVLRLLQLHTSDGKEEVLEIADEVDEAELCGILDAGLGAEPFHHVDGSFA